MKLIIVNHIPHAAKLPLLKTRQGVSRIVEETAVIKHLPFISLEDCEIIFNEFHRSRCLNFLIFKSKYLGRGGPHHLPRDCAGAPCILQYSVSVSKCVN